MPRLRIEKKGTMNKPREEEKESWKKQIELIFFEAFKEYNGDTGIDTIADLYESSYVDKEVNIGKIIIQIQQLLDKQRKKYMKKGAKMVYDKLEKEGFGAPYDYEIYEQIDNITLI